MKINLTLPMRVISKKNSKRLIMRGGRKFFVPSEAFERFKQDANASFYQQCNGKLPKIKGPVRIDCIFYIKGAYKVDVDNLYTSILDVLQNCGIIEDDNFVLEGYLKKIPGYTDWHTDIVIEELPINRKEGIWDTAT